MKQFDRHVSFFCVSFSHLPVCAGGSAAAATPAPALPANAPRRTVLAAVPKRRLPALDDAAHGLPPRPLLDGPPHHEEGLHLQGQLRHKQGATMVSWRRLPRAACAPSCRRQGASGAWRKRDGRRAAAGDGSPAAGCWRRRCRPPTHLARRHALPVLGGLLAGRCGRPLAGRDDHAALRLCSRLHVCKCPAARLLQVLRDRGRLPGTRRVLCGILS